MNFPDVDPKFKKWALSYSGCDGGNIAGTIWFCGIEFGGNESFDFSAIPEPPYVSDEQRKKFFGYQYNIKVAKLYAAICGEAQVAARDKDKYKDELFAKDSITFKMNLYPISFHDVSDDLWQEEVYRKTGLPTKSMYRAWCQINRFPVIRQWVKERSPRLIVCTGITCKNEFIMAFDDVKTIYEVEKLNKKKVSGRDLVWIDINEGKTILAITPFLGGRYGLNSDELLKNFGKEISDICKKKFNKDNWYKPE